MKHPRTPSQESKKKAKKGERRVIDADLKSIILKRIQDAFQLGARTGYKQQFFVGANSISKQLELGTVAVIAIARDSNILLHQHVVEAATLRHVPVCFLPRCSEELATTFKIRRCSCFAVASPVAQSKHGSDVVDTADQNYQSGEEIDCRTDDRLRATMDDVVELIASVAQCATA